MRNTFRVSMGSVVWVSVLYTCRSTLDVINRVNYYSLYKSITQLGHLWYDMRKSVSRMKISHDDTELCETRLITWIWTLDLKCAQGLDRLHQLTSSRMYNLRIDLADFNGNHRFAEYMNIGVGSPDTNYQLTVGTYSGNAGESCSLLMSCICVESISRWISSY